MTLGSLVYKVFFRPTLKIRYYIGHFGLMGWYKLHNGELQMKKAATSLPPVALLLNYDLEVSYLTGVKYWHQTIFCAYSLARALKGRVRINIYSDGTLTPALTGFISKALPAVNIINAEDLSRQINEVLPEKDFPTLRALREKNPFFRKLVDMRINDRYIVQLDSDMLFFNEPEELIKAYKDNENYFMQDTIPASYYVLPEDMISKDLGIPMCEKINSGILAYNSSKIDWHFVEHICAYLLQNAAGVHPPMFEQTLNAIIISWLGGKPLKPAYRILYADRGEETQPSDIVRHYIFKAKLPYFTTEWKKVIS
jgi:hypothetical protein